MILQGRGIHGPLNIFQKMYFKMIAFPANINQIYFKLASFPFNFNQKIYFKVVTFFESTQSEGQIIIWPRRWYDRNICFVFWDLESPSVFPSHLWLSRPIFFPRTAHQKQVISELSNAQLITMSSTMASFMNGFLCPTTPTTHVHSSARPKEQSWLLNCHLRS